MKIPVRYLPFGLNSKDSEKQVQMLKKSRSNYKKGKYFTRKPIKSFHSHPSKHVGRAQKIYNVEKVVPSKELAKATGCSIDALNQIVKKGEGAYFSSGSRPNQTAQSWGYARLASALTSGKAAAIDYNILEKGCNHKGKAFTLAKKARKAYGFGHGKSRRRKIL
jgi:DNA-binding Xre family transcriptional regulator